jgi:hypothetical protein
MALGRHAATPTCPCALRNPGETAATPRTPAGIPASSLMAASGRLPHSLCHRPANSGGGGGRARSRAPPLPLPPPRPPTPFPWRLNTLWDFRSARPFPAAPAAQRVPLSARCAARSVRAAPRGAAPCPSPDSDPSSSASGGPFAATNTSGDALGAAQRQGQQPQLSLLSPWDRRQLARHSWSNLAVGASVFDRLLDAADLADLADLEEGGELLLSDPDSGEAAAGGAHPSASSGGSRGGGPSKGFGVKTPRRAAGAAAARLKPWQQCPCGSGQPYKVRAGRCRTPGVEPDGRAAAFGVSCTLRSQVESPHIDSRLREKVDGVQRPAPSPRTPPAPHRPPRSRLLERGPAALACIDLNPGGP